MKRMAILNRLQGHGPLPLLAAGGILQGNYVLSTQNSVLNVPLYGDPLDPWSVLDSSVIYSSLSAMQKRHIRKMPRRLYDRLTKAFRGFANTLCLSVKDQSDRETYLGVLDLKIWFIKIALDNEDLAIGYLKKCADLCLALAFGTPKELDWSHGLYPNYPDRKDPLPFFRGQLNWIRERAKLFFSTEEELPQLTYNEYFILSQICVSKRALPFPSKKQVQDSVSSLYAELQQHKPIPREGIEAYKYSINKLIPFLNEKASPNTHISVSSSASFEESRAEGGRGKYISKIMQRTFSYRIDRNKMYIYADKVDMFGKRVFYPQPIDPYNITDFNFGNLIEREDDYVYPVDVFYKVIFNNYGADFFVTGTRLGTYSGDIILASMASEMLRYGRFEPMPSIMDPFPLWKIGENPVFFLERDIPSKASLSIESGLKARMVTCQPSWFTTLFQGLRHQIVEVLSKDQTLQIGLEENYKLWEFLKRIPKNTIYERIVSLDLKEATYSISFDILRANYELFERITPSSRLWRVIRTINHRPQRRVMFTTQVKLEHELQIDDFTSSIGSFMGEPLSFMHLTLLLRLISIIAESYAKYEEKFEKIIFPNFYTKVLNYGFPNVLSEHAGDDMIAFATKAYAWHFHFIVQYFGLILSKGKHGESKYFGVFCENFICLPKDPENIPKNCIFGSYAYLDIVKGRLLNSFSKVAGSERSPMLGQGSTLSTALQWWSGDSKLAKTLFWVANFSQLRKTHRMNLHFPPCFGGFELPMSKGNYSFGKDSFSDNCLSYIQGIYDLQDTRKFLYFAYLLRSIRTNVSKDIIIDNKLRQYLPGIIASLRHYTMDEVPFKMESGEPYMKYVSRLEPLGFKPWSELDNIVSRLNAFKALLNGIPEKESRDVSLIALRSRFNYVWSEIRSLIEPHPVLEQDLSKFSRKFTLREGQFFFRIDHIPIILSSTSLMLHNMNDRELI